MPRHSQCRPHVATSAHPGAPLRALFALPACQSTAIAPPPAAATPRAEPPNLSLLKQELKTYAAYEAGLAIVAAEARSWIEQRAPREEGRLAVVFDIDETILSNLPRMREMDFGYVPALWDRWVEMADATPIVPVVEVFRAARQHGVAVFFITGRKTTDADGTIRNLRQTGLGDYVELHLKPANSPGTTQAFKTETRRRITEQGYTIIANLGDQHSDLEGGYSERTFKLRIRSTSRSEQGRGPCAIGHEEWKRTSPARSLQRPIRRPAHRPPSIVHRLPDALRLHPLSRSVSAFLGAAAHQQIHPAVVRRQPRSMDDVRACSFSCCCSAAMPTRT